MQIDQTTSRAWAPRSRGAGLGLKALFYGLFSLLVVLWVLEPLQAQAAFPKRAFVVSLPRTSEGPITGRVFVVISRTDAPEVRRQGSADSPQTFAVAAAQWTPDKPIVIDQAVLGSPLRSLNDIPSGDYYVQAYVRIYVDYHRADGHVVWAMDQWNGTNMPIWRGNLYSKVQRVHIGDAKDLNVRLELTERSEASTFPPDTASLKYIKIQSALLSKFWGRPICLGAVVLLPKGYGSNPDERYPVIYEPRNHYRRDAPFGFTPEPVVETDDVRRAREQLGFESGYEFAQSWEGQRFPRMIAVTMIETTPFFDFASSMNSENNGPYEDAVMEELIPYIETHFRTIRQPWARVLIGKSSGGRDALSLQLHRPEFFGGAWVFYPWAFDYSRYFSFNIYKDTSAFSVDWRETQGYRGKNEWQPLDRIFVRSLEDKPIWTVRDWMLGEQVAGGPTGVGAEVMGSDNALNSPVGPDGYPEHLYDGLTGAIDPNVAMAWRSHDLMAYVQDNWPRIGAQLIGKLHFYVGDMDEWFRNYGIHDLQDYLEKATPYYAGSFTYGPLKGHEWQPMTNAELVRQVSDYVVQHASKDADTAWAKEQ